MLTHEVIYPSEYFCAEVQRTPGGAEIPDSYSAANNIYLNGVRVAVMSSDGGLWYYLTDQVDSVKVVTDDNGTAVTRMEYKPYGEEWFTEGEDNFAPKYNSQELDRETGYYFYNARHYDPEIARFVTADTVIDGEYSAIGWNRYAYCGNNPIIYKDPTGHNPLLVAALVYAAVKIILNNPTEMGDTDKKTGEPVKESNPDEAKNLLVKPAISKATNTATEEVAKIAGDLVAPGLGTVAKAVVKTYNNTTGTINKLDKGAEERSSNLEKNNMKIDGAAIDRLNYSMSKDALNNQIANTLKDANGTIKNNLESNVTTKVANNNTKSNVVSNGNNNVVDNNLKIDATAIDRLNYSISKETLNNQVANTLKEANGIIKNNTELNAK